MKNPRQLWLASILLVLASAAATAQTSAPAVDTLDQLLRQVEEGRVSDAASHAERLSAFRADRGRQQERLADIRQQEQQKEAISLQRETEFAANEQTLLQLQAQLDERLGSLKELFGVLQQVAGDAQGQFANSLVQIHYPERTQYLTDFAARMAQTSQLPSIGEIERLWFEIQREMTEAGRVVRLRHPVVSAQGKEEEREVVRVGVFNLVSNGHYMTFVPETGRIVELARQPAGRLLAGAQDLSEAQHGTVEFALDPVRGQLLALLLRAPQLAERIEHGGLIGYLIMALGAVVLLLALQRMVSLSMIKRQIKQQINNREQPGDNPLGRVLAVYKKNLAAEPELLELRVTEAILRELPGINRGLGFMKISAAVAPLMGLLGTVTGMIITFTAITLFGAGDPRLMAHGISQALVTTVQGLVVAIPTLLLHNQVQVRARFISDVLEQEAVAMVADRAEQDLARED